MAKTRENTSVANKEVIDAAEKEGKTELFASF